MIKCYLKYLISSLFILKQIKLENNLPSQNFIVSSYDDLPSQNQQNLSHNLPSHWHKMVDCETRRIYFWVMRDEMTW